MALSTVVTANSNIEGPGVEPTTVSDRATWDFDPAQYRLRYFDLSSLSADELAWHFYNVGRGEGRLGRLSRDELSALQPTAFNVNDYRRRYAEINHVSDAEAISHFLTVGLAEGRRGRLSRAEVEALSLESFDPDQYRRKYADIDGTSDAEAVQHFLTFGLPEGRSGLLSASRLSLSRNAQREGRETVIIVVHEATRSGVPLLAWNLAKNASIDRNVVVVLLSGGPLISDYEALDVDLVKLADGMPDDEREMKAIVERLIAEYSPSLAIVTSVVSYAAAVPLAAQGIPVVLTIHELPPPSHSPQSVIDAVKTAIHTAAAIVYSAEKIKAAFESSYSPELMADAILLRQGAYERPPAMDEPDASVELTGKVTTGFGAPSDLEGFVLGVGSVNARKGVEFFLQTAAYAKQIGIEPSTKFIWLGKRDQGTSPEYILALDEQIRSSELDDTVIFAGEVADVDQYYRRARVVLVPSRIDPLPNSALDALEMGIPVVSFDGAGGIAEIMKLGATASLVVPYLDSFAAAQRITSLLVDDKAHADLSTASRAVLHDSCLPMESYTSGLLALGVVSK